MADLFEPLALPNGTVLANRLAKAPMAESMAIVGQVPGAHLRSLYGRWSVGGVGLMITGNVMVDYRALSGPACVVLDEEAAIEPFRAWANTAHEGHAQFWLQLNHPGRQVWGGIPGHRLSPSYEDSRNSEIELGKSSRHFEKPTMATSEDIEAVIDLFATSAMRAELAGIDGVEIQAAYGFLISQFLSPLTNRRTDLWGGDIKDRCRFLLSVIDAIRMKVSPRFGLGVKLNSADFQRGGFDPGDAETVMSLLSGHGLDLLDLAGGSFDTPAHSDPAAAASTIEREKYYLEFVEHLIPIAPCPVMLTGGISRREIAEQVLALGASVAGLGTALALDPSLPTKWRAGQPCTPHLPLLPWKEQTKSALGGNAFIRYRMKRLSQGVRRGTRTPVRLAVAVDRLCLRQAERRYRRWFRTRSTTEVDVSQHSPKATT